MGWLNRILSSSEAPDQPIVIHRGDEPVERVDPLEGTDMSLWDACLPLLLPDFRLLRIDARGHGASDAPAGEVLVEEPDEGQKL